MDEKTIQYIDMFSGIGGFREGFTRAGGFQCVGHCEIDKHADRSYRALFDTEGRRFYSSEAGIKCKPQCGLQDRGLVCEANDAQSVTKEWFCEDARKADPDTMPKFDLLCGGFPC